MTTKKVTVHTSDAPISYLDQSGQEVSLGAISTRSYECEGLTRYAMVKNPGTENEKLSDVGIGKHNMALFMNHAEAQRPMFDLGFTLADISIGRGGADIYTLWEYPDGQLPTITDPITWDVQSWGPDRARYAGMPLKPGVILSGTLRSGRGYTWSSAVLRLICTNGLTRWQGSGVLMKANGSNFEPKSLADALFKVPTETRPVIGRNIGNLRGVSRTIGLLNDFFVNTTDPTERSAMIERTPAVLTDTLSALDRAPSWMVTGIIDQLNLFYSNTSRDMAELDAQNVVTNAINFPRFGPRNAEVEAPTHSASRAFRMSSSITQSLVDLVGIYSLAA